MNNLNDCPIQIDWVVQENIILNTVSKYSFEVVLRSELIEEHQGWGKTTLAAGVGNKILWWQVFGVDDSWGRFYQSAYKNCYQHKDFVTKSWKLSPEIVKWNLSLAELIFQTKDCTPECKKTSCTKEAVCSR